MLIDDCLAEVNAESTIDNSVAALIANLQGQGDQTKMQQLLTQLKALLQSNGSTPAPVATVVVDTPPDPPHDPPAQ